MKYYHATYCAALALLLVSVAVSMSSQKAPHVATDADGIYHELLAKSPTGDEANIARTEFAYWHRPRIFRGHGRQIVVTKDGNTAELILLRAPATGMPANDFPMVILLRGKSQGDKSN